MSRSPFAADPAVATRRAALVARTGVAFADHLEPALAAVGRDPVHPRAIVPAEVVRRLVRDLDLTSVEEVMLLALATARELASPPVSDYHVGAVGLAERSGDLLLGGNLELPGASIWHTVHGEGSVTLLARARGERIATLALTQARPCAHCRQVLTEIDGAHGDEGRPPLRLIDPAGHVLTLPDLYPWPFAPDDLGVRGCVPGVDAWPGLALRDPGIPPRVAAALVAAGRRAHAPYSGAPSAVVLRLHGEALLAGSVLENVAFNPTIGPLQDALVIARASGTDLAAVDAAWLAEPAGAPVSHAASTRDALATLVPEVAMHVTYWS